MSTAQPTEGRTASFARISTGTESALRSASPSATQKESSEDEAEQVYPPMSKAIAVIIPIFLTAFLVALDRLIISVAVPSITNDFDSLGDVGWYGSAYLLTSAAFMLPIGRLYTMVNPKWVYLSALIMFEVGSTLCGAAPNSKALIVGRAIAGLGQAGLFQGGIIMIVFIVPLHKRPLVMGLGGMIFGVAMALGPLLGGESLNTLLNDFTKGLM